MADTTILTCEQQRERLDVALDATYEIESIAIHLNACMPMEPASLFLRALVVRVLSLNGVVMSALGGEDDSDRSTGEMRRIVEGLT